MAVGFFVGVRVGRLIIIVGDGLIVGLWVGVGIEVIGGFGVAIVAFG